MPRPFDVLEDRLLRAGIAPRHVRRYLRELKDHLADLTADSNEATAFARLGNIDDLVKAMTDRREFYAWTARAPWATLLIGPVFAVFLLDLAITFAVVQWNIALGLDPASWKSGPMPHAWFPAVAQHILTIGSHTAPMWVGLGIAFLAARQRVRMSWPIVGLSVVSFFGALVMMGGYWPDHPGGAAALYMNVGQFAFTRFADPIGVLHFASVALVPWCVTMAAYALLRIRNNIAFK